MDGQRGQALVGVLVVMTLVFLLAGAVAVGTSTLVTSVAPADRAVAADLNVQSAVGASVARVSACQLAASGKSTQSSSPAFQITLPDPKAIGGPTQADVYCIGAGSLAAGSPSVARMSALPAGQTSCFRADLSPAPAGDWWLLFSLRGLPGSGTAVVTDGGQGSCPSSGKCSASLVSSSSPEVQVAMPCTATGVSSPTLYVNVKKGGLKPGDVFVATRDVTASGTAYLIAAGTGRAGQGVDFEELLVQSAAKGAPTLAWEEPLP